MRIFALILALFCVGVADAARPIRRAPIRAGFRAGIRAPFRIGFRAGLIRNAFRAPFRAFRAPIIIGRQNFIAPIQQLAVRRNFSTYSAYVAPSALTVQRIVAAPYTAPIVQQEKVQQECAIQQVVAPRRQYLGFSGGCGGTQSLRRY